MPTTYAHYKYGQDVLAGLPKEYQDLINKNKTLYDIGLHGPDILFYSNPLRKLSRMGSDIHYTPGKDFFNMGKTVIENAESQEEREAELAYLLGYICHHTLDSIDHPYVQKFIDVTGVLHFEIEMELDRDLLIKEGKDPLGFNPTSHLILTEKVTETISKFYIGLRPSDIKTTLTIMKIFLNEIRKPNPTLRKIIFPLIGEKAQGLFMSFTPNPKCDRSTEVLEKHMFDAVPIAQQTIKEYIDFLDGRANLPERFDLTFEHGKDWKDLKV
ncbi:MAG: zinc dependent phospholipase C family protein [Clostridia bacterium]|nr:zinc dependent phospholipase C family protein [Clostridia bacterium]